MHQQHSELGITTFDLRGPIPKYRKYRIGSQCQIDNDALTRWQQLMQDLMHYAFDIGGNTAS